MAVFRDQPRAYTADLTALLPGAKFYFFEVGTDDPKDTYADMKVVAPLVSGDPSTFVFGRPHPHPIIADEAARLPPIYLSGNYRLLVEDSAGNEIHDIDPFESPYLLPGPELVSAIGNSGEVLPLATLTFFKSNTTALETGDYDNPLTANIDGEFVAVELDDGKAYRVLMQDADGRLIYDVDPWIAGVMQMGVAEGGPVTYVPSSKDAFSLTPSTSMTFMLVNADIDPEEFPDSIVVVAISMQTPATSGVTAPTSVTIGGITAALQWQLATVGFGTGRDHVVVAYVRVPEEGLASGSVVVTWPSISTSGTVVKANANAFYNVDPSSDDFALGFVATSGLTAGPLNAPANGGIYGANIQYTGGDFSPRIKSSVDETVYTMQAPSVAILDGSYYQTGYRLFDEDFTESLVTQQEDGTIFRPIIAFVMAGTG